MFIPLYGPFLDSLQYQNMDPGWLLFNLKTQKELHIKTAGLGIYYFYLNFIFHYKTELTKSINLLILIFRNILKAQQYGLLP